MSFSHCLAAAALSLVAASAFAVTITPPGPGGAAMPFSAVGPAKVSKLGIDLDCKAVFSGTVDGYGNVAITSASFSGGALCKLIKPTASVASPWTGHVDTATQLTLDNVSVNVKSPIAGGLCGPTKIVGSVADNGSETVIGLDAAQLSGGCSITATLNTTPYMRVTP
ncbi:hypothetical protein [Chromobacterium haemolyticum]|uniref:Activator protein n=1 Tax=Chromobacterium haemolyticum TaxID=394935 RepID=A0A1W0D1U9_9NEIS|nr:hypothetical protein [Chromobacterium haemolyticum]OQS40981.1 hypothetical protein B0T45_09090 [Chromobacterium haemolyticum]